ncbi:MAG: ankyrin repeat domain-containing protein [Armatimonas sp.]
MKRYQGIAVVALFSLVVVPVALTAPQELPTTSLTEAAVKKLSQKLADAISKNNVKLTRTLLNQGADPNTLVAKYGGGLLHVAAANGKTELVRALLDKGANAAMRNSTFETPADLARKAGHTALAELLKKAEDGDYIPLPQTPPTPPAPRFTVPAGVKKAGKAAQDKVEAARKKLKDYNYVKENFGRF